MVTCLCAGSTGPYCRAMSRFTLTRIDSQPCPSDPGRSRHITEVEVHGPEGFRQLPVAALRLMLSSGDNVVATSAKTRADVDVRKGKCACGVSTVRSVNGSRRVDDLDVPALTRTKGAL